MSGTWASGWVTGDIVTAAEFGKGVGLIADETKGAATATFDFSSLPSTYAHLRVLLYARGDTAASNTAVGLRFNNDSGSNYDNQRGVLTGGAGTWTSTEAIATTDMTIGVVPASTAPADSYACYVVDIPHYAGSADHKVICGNGSAKIGTTTGNFQIRVFSGWWRSTAAVNRITFILNAGNFDVGSRCSVYAFGD